MVSTRWMRLVRAVLTIMVAMSAPVMVAQLQAQVRISPAVRSLSGDTFSGIVQLDQTYPRASIAHARIVGAFEIEEPPGVHLLDATSLEYLPVFMSFSDGSCDSFQAQNVAGSLSDGSLTPVSCDTRPKGYATGATMRRERQS